MKVGTVAFSCNVHASRTLANSEEFAGPYPRVCHGIKVWSHVWLDTRRNPERYMRSCKGPQYVQDTLPNVAGRLLRRSSKAEGTHVACK